MSIHRTPSCTFSIVLFGIIFSAATEARAQTPVPSPSPTPVVYSSSNLEHQFFKNILRDQKAIWTSPFHLHGADARWLVPLGAGTATLIATDRRTADEMAEFHRQLNASRLISYVGSGYGAVTIAGTFYLAGRATHNERARETGILGAEALIDSGIVVTALKEITQRSRPRAGVSRGDFFDGGSSFPSGHSIEAWSMATVIASEYHDHRAIQFAAYGLATTVSIARFTGRNHFLSDILVGSAMGYGIGRYVYHAHHVKPASAGGDEEEARSKRMPAIEPLFNRGARQYGLALSWNF